MDQTVKLPYIHDCYTTPVAESFVPKLHGFYLGILSIRSAPYVVITVPSQDYNPQSPTSTRNTVPPAVRGHPTGPQGPFTGHQM